ncbi:MAG TPA: DNA polymerase I [Kofleriaceae bacterium]|nr:DNA polymerase I [Kofleriaceae bacterium]
MERLHIMDGHGYIFRAHYGLMNSSRGERKEVRLSTAEGMPTGAIYVFARMLMRLHDDLRPERMAVVFDSGRKSFRNEIFPAYKATRSAPPEDLAIQMPYFRPLVEAMGWPVIAQGGVEADDVIATLVTQAKARGWEVCLFSADKDLMQLVAPGVNVIDAMRQFRYTREAVIEKFGVPPERVADFLALKGDTSDNIPGVQGVGDKTAADLVNAYPDIEALIAANPKVRGKHPLGDPEMVERLRISRKLVELDVNVELPVALDDLKVGEWNAPELGRMFKELEFEVMVDRVSATPAPALPQHEPQQPLGELHEPVVAATADEIRALVAAARAAAEADKAVAVAVEWTGRFDRASLIGVAVAVPGDAPVYVPIGHRSLAAGPIPDAAALAPLAELLADPLVGKIVHDGKSALRTLQLHGWDLAGVVEDPMLCAFLLDATKVSEAPEVIAGQVTGITVPPRAQAAGKGGFEATAPAEAAAWVGRVVEATLHAGPELARRVEIAELAPLYREVELPIARLLAHVEQVGVCIDAAHFAKLSEDVGAQIATLERQVFERIGHEINLGSPKQLGHLLFEELGLTSDRMKKTKTGYSVDADVLEGLIDADPIIKWILEHRELIKLKGTYLDALPPLVNPRTGRVHTIFNQVVAATGRISSQDPNLQNIPIRSDQGRAIRKGFVAAPGKILVAADYSQIELRILAHLSHDPVLVRSFNERVDVHTQTAAEVFDKPASDVTANDRRIAKAVNYGLAYGQSDFGLAHALDIPRKEAAEYKAKYFARFPTIAKFMEDVVAEARARGGARTILGRWRPIPDLKSKTMVARNQAQRIAQNTPMQGAGADLIKLAMLRTTERLAERELAAELILTVHDELVFETTPELAEVVGDIVKTEMEGVYKLDVPLDVDVGIAESWADA